MTLLPVDLPRDFPFMAFKCLGTAPSQGIALPFQLSGAATLASGVQPLTQSFVDTSGFAVAVSSDDVIGLIDIDAIRQAINSYSLTLSVDLWAASISVTYRLRFTSGPTLSFQNSAIAISGAVAVETDAWFAPNGSVTFQQLIALTLDTANQTVNSCVLAIRPSVNRFSSRTMSRLTPSSPRSTMLSRRMRRPSGQFLPAQGIRCALD